jgi:hypothetical protein
MSYIGNPLITKFQPDSVTSIELAENAVESSNIITGAVTSDKIEAGAVVNSVNGLTGAVSGIQPSLVSGVNIKTLGGVNILGSGDMPASNYATTLKFA